MSGAGTIQIIYALLSIGGSAVSIAFGMFCGIIEALHGVAALAMLVQSRDESTQLKD